ncbi:hypothetical protein ABEB36_013548 [Hypothenemus hampei]|uniref:Uncharacterized protein n=1 Tax=Hypothenemus hampei TaxID=57062 RepID=A0ABD1E4Q9_HYPHA
MDDFKYGELHETEMAVMYYVYGLADGNAMEARPIYQERHLNRALPDSRTFSNTYCRRNDSFHKGTSEGRPGTVRITEIEEADLQ